MPKLLENIDTVVLNKIRREWSNEKGRWYFSVVDVIGILTDSKDARNYWKVLKSRLKNTQNELVTACNQLKMVSNDGKFYLTDALDSDMILELIKFISPSSIYSFETYFESSEIGSYPQKTSNIFEENTTSKNNSEVLDDDEFVLMVDGYWENNIITIEAFVAGIIIDNILISATVETITIKGKRKQLKNTSIVTEKNYSLEELSWGTFSRTVDLPSEIEIDKVRAFIERGLLTIKLPVINKKRSKIIEIKSL